MLVEQTRACAGSAIARACIALIALSFLTACNQVAADIDTGSLEWERRR